MSTFLFSTTAVMLAYSQGLINIYFLLFLMSFISMQLIEFFLWTYLNNSAFNALFSKAEFALICSQPLFMLLTLPDSSPYKKELIYGYLACVTLFIVLYPIDFKTIIGKNGHLEWKWLRIPGFALLVWFAFFLAPSAMREEWALLAFLVGTALYSYMNYTAYGTWGSMWCWIANVTAFVYLGKVAYKFLTGRKPIEF
jgi:hypothetical protein